MPGQLRSVRTEKRDYEQPAHVIGRKKRDYCDGNSGPKIMLVGDRQKSIFAPEPSERRAPNQGQGRSRKSPESNRHLFFQAAHFPNDLLVVQAVDDRASAKEQESLEKGVGEQVE